MYASTIYSTLSQPSSELSQPQPADTDLQAASTAIPAQSQSWQMDPLVYPPGAASVFAQAAPRPATDAAATPAAAASTSPLDDPALAPLMADSPTLRADAALLKNKGFSVTWGAAGGGTAIDESVRRLVIDGDVKGDPLQLAQDISHEAGHVKYVEPEDLSSKAAYVNMRLRDEGAATLNTAQVRKELLDAGHPDIGFIGIHSDQYQAISERHLAGQITRSEAINQIANAYRTELASNTGETYEAYYGAEWV